MQFLINRDNTATSWEDFRVDLEEGAVMPPDSDILDMILCVKMLVDDPAMQGAAAIVERGDRHLIVRITYPKWDV